MNRLYFRLFLSIIIALICISSKADTKRKGSKLANQTKAESRKLNEEGRKLDQQLLDINRKIQEIIKKYKLLSTKGIRVLPYRITYRLGKDYIEIETYKFNRDILVDNRIIGIQTKRIRMYISGKTVSKMVSEISEKNYDLETTVVVQIIDPSPTTLGTNDIKFDFISGKLKFIENKKLGDIRNNIEFPVRNSIKKDFLIPHFTFFYNTIQNIADAYYKKFKDVDKEMTNFLLKSLEY